MHTRKELEAHLVEKGRLNCEWCATSWECSVWIHKGRKSELS